MYLMNIIGAALSGVVIVGIMYGIQGMANAVKKTKKGKK